MILLTKGPLPIAMIQQHSRLPLKAIKEALFVLIQHNLVLYRQDAENVSMVTYKVDLQAVLMRLAYPIFVVLTEECVSGAAADTLLNVLRDGRMQAKDDAQVKELLAKGILQVCTPQCSQYSLASEEQVLPPTSPIKSPSKGGKRNATPPSTTTSPAKRSKNGELSANAYVRLNAEYFVQLIREDSLRLLASDRINVAAGLVMQAALHYKDGIFSPFQVSSQLPPHTSLPIDTSRSASRLTPVAEYMEALAQSFSDFIIKEDIRPGGNYSLDWRKALRRMRLTAIEAYIRDVWGTASLRLFRLLAKQNYLEEKTISKVALMTPRETRDRLYKMLKMGLVHLQEVPRTQDHAPSRTFFLWTIPEATLMTLHRQRLIQVICNAVERMQKERQVNEMLISKSERLDVVANPKLLSEGEQKQLSALRRNLNRLSSAVYRCLTEYALFIH